MKQLAVQELREIVTFANKHIPFFFFLLLLYHVCQNHKNLKVFEYDLCTMTSETGGIQLIFIF